MRGASTEEETDDPAERDVLSLVRLLRYALREAESLQQLDAVALIEAALRSLQAAELMSAAEAAEGSTGADRVQGLPSERRTRAH